MGLGNRIVNTLRAAARAWVLGDTPIGALNSPSGIGLHIGGGFPYHPQEIDPSEYVVKYGPVYGAIMLRADLLAMLGLQAFTMSAAGEKQETPNSQALQLLNYVNPFWSPFRLLHMTEQALNIWGNAFWMLERGKSGKGRPREIWYARPDRVEVLPHEDKYISGYLFYPQHGGKPIPFTTDEVIWFNLPDAREEFEGLSPLLPAGDAVNYGVDAINANRKLFQQGMNPGGAVWPKNGATWDNDQVDEMAELLDRRFAGVDKAHRWAVFQEEIAAQPLSAVTPREAEYLKGLEWSQADINRIYRIPPELFGGQRTYENYEVALKAVYQLAVKPRAAFLSSELSEQYTRHFGEEKTTIEFDYSNVDALQADRAVEWEISRGEIEAGTLTINEYRESVGREKVPWGDVPRWSIDSKTEADPETDPADELAEEFFDSGRGGQRLEAPDIPYGGETHRLAWSRFVRMTDRHEETFKRKLEEVFRRLTDSVVDRAKERSVRGPLAAADEPFSLAQWRRIFLREFRGQFVSVVTDAGNAAIENIGIALAFDVADFEAQRFIEQRAQRFAERVTDTTWKQLRAALGDAIVSGATGEQIEETIKQVMGGRIQSSAETIARTEINGAANGATQIGWEMTGVVESKTWLSALSNTTRDGHANAHGQTVPLGDNFTLVNSATGEISQGPTPGQMGSAADDINCQCTMVANLIPDARLLAPVGRKGKSG